MINGISLDLTLLANGSIEERAQIYELFNNGEIYLFDFFFQYKLCFRTDDESELSPSLIKK